MTRTIAQIEVERLALQTRLDAEKSTAERNKLGQFATPTELARDILQFGRGLLGARKTIHFLDPAIGTGAFYSALRAVAPAAKIGRSIGFDIDPHYAEPAIRLWQDSPLELRIADFSRVTPPDKERERANLLICNPPYVRHHHLSTHDKQRLQALVSARLGIRPNGLSGLYCYFLLLADAWLMPGGVSGWLIPSEWMDVNYGAQIKEYLTRHVRLLRIHRFDPSKVQFDDALVSSTVVWFEKAAPRGTDKAEFSYGGSLASPARIASVERSTLCQARKWTQLSDVARTSQPAQESSRAARPGAMPRLQARRTNDPELTLADIFVIKRGMATGCNRFFVLPQSEIQSLGLPMNFFRPILPSPRHLEVDEIAPLEDGNPDIQKKQFVLTIQESEHVIRERYPRLWSYLQEGMEQGIHERYLCRHRRPWYAQEDRPPAPILCTYMGRQTEASERPFRFILNRSRATAANVYLLLYPRPVLMRAVSADERLVRRLWVALNRVSIQVLVGEGRVYGGGLYKLEPQELANVPLASLGVEMPHSLVARQHVNLELFPTL